jgi:diguanylate cyclase (GGDEF)-like protein
MKEEKKRIVMQWAFPTLILVVAVVWMVISFNINSKADAAASVERTMLAIAERYSATLYHKLTAMADATMLASEALAQINYGDNKSNPEVLHILSALGEHSPAYTVVLSDSAGKGVDNNGAAVDLSSSSYFSELMEKDEGTFLHVEESDVNGQNAVAYKHAIPGGGDWLIAYYGLSDIQNSITQYDLNGDVLYMIVDNDGMIIASAQRFNGTPYQSKFLKNNNLYTALESTYKDEARRMRGARSSSPGATTSGGVKVELDDEGRSLVYTQFQFNRWQVIIGATSSYVDRREREEYAVSQNTLRNLAIAFSAFAVIMVGINMWSRFAQTATTKVLAEKADTDLLTGLCNKIATERKAQEYFTNNPNEQAIMFVLDIDNFKKINDTMGHAFGDEVLRSLGQQITPIFRASDIIGRIGGDEMIILLKNINNDEILLREATKVARFFHEFKAGEYVKYSATASIGAAIFPRDGKDFEAMYKAADQALYMAKKRGKNQLAFYHDTFEGIVIKS